VSASCDDDCTYQRWYERTKDDFERLVYL